jgi:hypothetical protein
MSDFDFGGLKAARERRKQFPVTVAIDPGSTEYLFKASYEDIRHAFQHRFENVNFERQLALHSSIAGTTIEVVLTALSVGGGIVVSEILKNIGKDLWTALKDCFSSKAAKTKTPSNGHDTGPGHDNRIREFIDDALPRLVELHHELEQNDGRSHAPPMVIPASTSPKPT